MQYDLSLEDVNVCKTKNAKSNQLAFGVMLSFFKRYTQFPMATEANISSELILQVAKSLDIDPLFIVPNLGEKPRTCSASFQHIKWGNAIL